MMTVTTSLMTADELLQMPDDGCRYELIKGELIKMSPAGEEHGSIAMQFGWRLASHVEQNKLGRVYAAETGFLISTNPDTVRAPDVAFIGFERVAEEGRVTGYWPGAPDLVVEVISPNDPYSEVEENAMEWLKAGCRMVVVLNPRRQTATVFRSAHEIALHSNQETLNLDEVVKDFSVPVGVIFG